MGFTMGRRAMAADLVLRGGLVVTLDPWRPRGWGVALGGGRVLAVGKSEGDDFAALCDERTRVVELHDRVVVPGFVDAHVHFGSFALSRQQVDLDGAGSLEDGLRIVGAFAARLTDEDEGTWLRGRGWDRNRWGGLPTAGDLDSVTRGRPAALASHDGHSLWLNSAAMRATGLTEQTETPAGGVIERDAQGRPSGVVFENAQDLVRR